MNLLDQAKPAQQVKLLAQLRDGTAAINGRTLAFVIPQMEGPLQDKARTALVQRLGKLKPAVLRELLENSDLETCRAIVAVCTAKKYKSFIPDLLTLLEDPAEEVILLARNGLKELTGQDHGPADNPTLEQRFQALVAWRDWWDKEKPKKNK